MTVAVNIRTAIPDDSAAIQEVHARAFGGPAEAKLVRLICERKKALISLVAVSDGQIVGHILNMGLVWFRGCHFLEGI